MRPRTWYRAIVIDVCTWQTADATRFTACVLTGPRVSGRSTTSLRGCQSRVSLAPKCRSRARLYSSRSSLVRCFENTCPMARCCVRLALIQTSVSRRYHRDVVPFLGCRRCCLPNTLGLAMLYSQVFTQLNIAGLE